LGAWGSRRVCMLKNMRVLAVAGLVSAVVALGAVALTESATLSADRGTRADSNGYTQVAWGVSAQRSGR
jgi:hypothetical protein